MPTYPYRCSSCTHEFEEFQSIVDEPLETCPKCGGKIHRVISGGAGLIFKGSGFYATDYRSAKYKKDASADTSASGSSSSSSSSSSDSSKKTKSEKKKD